LLELLSYSNKKELLKEKENESWIEILYKNQINLFKYPSLINYNDENLDIENKAKYFYFSKKYLSAYNITNKLIKKDKYEESLMELHICLLVELSKKSELYAICSNLYEYNNKSSLTWFAIGCYYYLIKKYDLSRKNFTKSVSFNEKNLSSHFGIGKFN
jgi:anaphase-promoting complex subunit 6